MNDTQKAVVDGIARAARRAVELTIRGAQREIDGLKLDAEDLDAAYDEVLDHIEEEVEGHRPPDGFRAADAANEAAGLAPPPN